MAKDTGKRRQPTGSERFGTGKAYFIPEPDTKRKGYDADDPKTHKKISWIGRIRRMKVDGVRVGSAGGNALCYLWMFCYGDEVTVSVNKLAKAIDVNWERAARCIKALKLLGLIEPARRKDGTEIEGKWIVVHETDDETDDEE